jgi:hypothetical protein
MPLLQTCGYYKSIFLPTSRVLYALSISFGCGGLVDNQYSLCLRIIGGREEQHRRGRATFRREIKTCYQSDFSFIGWTLTRGRAAII